MIIALFRQGKGGRCHLKLKWADAWIPCGNDIQQRAAREVASSLRNAIRAKEVML